MVVELTNVDFIAFKVLLLLGFSMLVAGAFNYILAPHITGRR